MSASALMCPLSAQATAASGSQRTSGMQVSVTHVDICLDDGQSDTGTLVERSYAGTVLGAIVTGSNRTCQVHSVARSLVKVNVQARVRSCFSTQRLLPSTLGENAIVGVPLSYCSKPSMCCRQKLTWHSQRSMSCQKVKNATKTAGWHGLVPMSMAPMQASSGAPPHLHPPRRQSSSLDSIASCSSLGCCCI